MEIPAQMQQARQPRDLLGGRTMETKIRTQKFGLGDLLSQGWKLYRTGLAEIVPIILCVYIPVNLISMLVLAYNPDAFSISSILRSFLGVVATMAIAYVVENKVQGQSATWDRALKFGLSKWLTAFFTGLLAGLIILGLSLLLIVPGIIWAVYYTFWVYAVALRNLDTTYALGYSKDLVKGQWWRVCGITIVIAILTYVVTFVIGMLSILLPTSPAAEFVTYTITDIVIALFTVTSVVFFLNVDYLKHPAVVAANDEREWWVCKNCGAVLLPGAISCHSCGARIVRTVGAS